MDLPPEVVLLAEDMNTHLPLRRGDRRIETPAYVLFLSSMPGPFGTVVQRLRFVDHDLNAVVSEVRSILSSEGRPAATWEVGPSTKPGDVAERLQALGMVPASEPLATAMVLDEPPLLFADPPLSFEVQPVITLAEFAKAQDIFWRCFGHMPDPEAAQAIVLQDFAHFEQTPEWLRFLVIEDGQAVAAADATVTPFAIVLSGGATLPSARGRGCYRALLAARWQEAVRRGIPRLVIQAGSMSRPILASLGFREVASIRIFLDEVRR